MERRQFLQTVGLAGASALWGGCVTSSPGRKAWSANDAIRVGVVGLGNKGGSAVHELLAQPGVRVTALCDCDRARLDQWAAFVKGRGTAAETYVDFRALLDKAPVDAVVINTPNHQHALQTIWACEAGRDVYVEKPVSHTMFESAQLQKVAARYGRIVQAGTQNRSDTGLIPAFKAVRDEQVLGKIKRVRGFCYNRRGSIGRVDGPQPIPASVDYNLWCGPVPEAPLRRKNLHYDWHWVWSTGNGDIGNQGPHELDLIRWLTGEDQPRRVLSLGGRLGYDDDGQTPNTQLVLFDFPRVPVLFEVRGLPQRSGLEAMDQYRGIRVGVVVECEHGSFAGGRGGGWLYDEQGKRVKQFPGDSGGGHLKNFFEAMRSGRTADLRAPVADAARSADLSHMANLSHRVGAAAGPEVLRERLQGHPEAAQALELMLTHLDANGVDPSKTPLTLGAWLEWSARRRRFTGGVGADEANALMAHQDRAPFVVPKL